MGLSIGTLRAMAADAPASADELVKRLESALVAKDKGAILALTYWQGADDRVKTMQQEGVALFFEMPVKSVKLAPLPAGFQTEYDLDGSHYRPTIPVVGLIDIEFTTPGNSMQQPYGQKDGKFYLPSVASEKIPGAAATKDKPLNIRVNVRDTSPPGTFEGSYTYVQSGKDITQPLVDLHHSGAVGTTFFGDRFKSCVVRKTSPGGTMSVVLMEDGKEVFKKEGVSGNEPVAYAAKP